MHLMCAVEFLFFVRSKDLGHTQHSGQSGRAASLVRWRGLQIELLSWQLVCATELAGLFAVTHSPTAKAQAAHLHPFTSLLRRQSALIPSVCPKSIKGSLSTPYREL